ncbi:MAG TPA: hypothetical protein VKA14_05670 [Gammaproteobacteria bacterium]|nr:hypothetical protein [Gammaproteobacteria bacterium]
MARYPDDKLLADVQRQLDSPQPLPNEKPVRRHVVNWHVFRRRDDAADFSRNILLEDGEHIVAGQASDSIGSLWWVGVHVDDLEAWGNRDAIQLTDRVDPQNPGSPML